MPSMNSSKVEREEIMLLYHSDGAVDLIAGAVLANMGLDLLNNSTTASLFTWIPILLLSSIKNRYSVPRLGYQALKADDKIVRSWTAQSAIYLAIALLVIGSVVVGDPLGLQTRFAPPLQGNVLCLAFGLIAGLGTLLAAWRVPLKRFYTYAGVILVSSLVSYFFLPVYVPVFISAAVMVVQGFRLTMAFNRRYPEPEKDKKIIDVKEKKKK